MRKIKRSALVSRLDARFAEYIKKRDRRCVICGKTTALQCSHYFGRIRYSTRWDEMNAASMCSGCHLKHHQCDPEMYHDYMVGKYGDDALEALRRKSWATRKYTDNDLHDLMKFYEEKIKRLEGMWL